jgi:hypothetical protein
MNDPDTAPPVAMSAYTQPLGTVVESLNTELEVAIRYPQPRRLTATEGHTLDSAAQSYDAWTISLRLSPGYNRSLDALLKTGPFKSYAPPNRYSLLKVKATFDSVKDDYHSEFLSTTSPSPPSHGSCLVEGQTLMPDTYDVSMFTVQSLVAVEVSVGPGTVLLLRHALHLPPWQPSWNGPIHARETERGLHHKSPEAEGCPFCG